MMEERHQGAIILAVSSVAFVYLTLWLLVTPILEDNPFVREDLPLLVLFPPREWGISAITLTGKVYRNCPRKVYRDCRYCSYQPAQSM